ncbi:hypothetical protein [Lactiplantibacillus daowaiensis]|uniref:Uncharacterized protein n=1 Tax=Lactiplantibacillus daowaiensis TaxID=2559918 RepID=A0ABW1RYJ8_9LACO|nr:hypothetical protein [Lactiplantibacillus daowaiensis]
MTNEALTVKFDNQSKILKYDPFMLYIRVKPLTPAAKPINCIVVQHALTLFYQLKPDLPLALYGHYNQRHQFVITKYMIRTDTHELAS